MKNGSTVASATSTTRTIHVVVTCTDRKTREPVARARDLPRSTLTARLGAWRDLLAESARNAVAAEGLYAGDHWQVVRNLPASAPTGVAVRVWVCSAGVGLVEFGTPVSPYAATFSPNHADSVAPAGSAFTAADWWGALSEWPVDGAELRSIVAVAQQACGPKDVLLVAVSEQYLTAVHADVLAASRVLGERLALLSTGARQQSLRRHGVNGESLADRLLPADARLKTLVGGAMQSLNARLARRAVQTADVWADDPSRLAGLLSLWTAEAIPAEVPDRTRADDEMLRGFIRDAVRENPRATYTGLLRILRMSGRACEQSRFRGLFEAVAAENSAASPAARG